MDVIEGVILGESANTHWYYVSKGKAIEYFLNRFSAKSVLDVGAGSGIFSKRLLSKPIAASARCVDTAYEFDEKLEIHHGKNLRFVKEAHDIDESLILMIDILEHIEDDIGFLKAYVDRIPAGSYMLIAVPAFSFLWSGHDVFLGHKRRYTLSGLESLVKNAGLEALQGRYFFGLLFPLIALIRLRNRRLLKQGKLVAKSDLSKPNNYINRLLIALHILELKILFPINRAAGLTAFCLAQKT
jgi:hypothetical protein